MLTSKGTIQGFNGVAAVDKKHQIIVEAQTFGEGQEYHSLKPIFKGVQARFERIKVSPDILSDGIIITADTGFANKKNNLYLRDSKINAYIPDNQLRSRDKKFAKQKQKYGKRHQDTKVGIKQVIPESEFKLNQRRKTCVCPAGNALWLKNEVKQSNGNIKLAFEGKLTDCCSCALKQQCMRNPESANDRTGHGRQVAVV